MGREFSGTFDNLYRSQPAGFGSMMRGRERRSGVQDRRAAFGKPRNAPSIVPEQQWPQLVIGRKIDMAEAGKAWRKFRDTLDVRVRAKLHGDFVLPLKNLMCVYVDPESMADMLADRYPRVTREFKDSGRNRVAQDVASQINQFIGSQATAILHSDMQLLLREDHGLGARAQDPDNSDLVRRAEALRARRDDSEIWEATEFQTGTKEAFGVQGFGLRLVDEHGLMARENRTILAGLGELGLQTSSIQVQAEDPLVQLVDTSPRSVIGLEINFPGYPPTIPLQPPHAYVLD